MQMKIWDTIGQLWLYIISLLWLRNILILGFSTLINFPKVLYDPVGHPISDEQPGKLQLELTDVNETGYKLNYRASVNSSVIAL